MRRLRPHSVLEQFGPEIVLIAATFIGLALTSLAISRDVRVARGLEPYQP